MFTSYNWRERKLLLILVPYQNSNSKGGTSGAYTAAGGERVSQR